MAQRTTKTGGTRLPVYVLNGPNLNLLGNREPKVYGSTTLPEIEKAVGERCTKRGLVAVCRQSNHEGELIGWLHEARSGSAAVILNAGGLSHTSVSLLDACRALEVPLIEVHLSNPYRRESYRRHSYVSEAATGQICGLGAAGYLLAIDAIATLLGGTAE